MQEKVEVKMSVGDAIKMIQVHERARQGRLRAKFMRDIRQQEERERLAATRGAPTLDPDIAATRIEKVTDFVCEKCKIIIATLLNHFQTHVVNKCVCLTLS